MTQLPTAEEVGGDLGIEVEREFTWDTATDFVVQGFQIPANTAPSAVIDPIEDADFEGGAGFELTDPKHEVFMKLDVARFASNEDALAARDVLHEEDLKQPCFGACVVTPTEYELEGIPDSAAVHRVPMKGKLPPDLFPFEEFLAEFAIGSDLYVISVNTPPGRISSDEFDRAVKAVYDHASQRAES